jgi:serine/threonine-protein kinase
VHRDVKPGNVLLTRSGTVKVTDFGIARAGTSEGLTQTGSVMGTATYFSPEQAQGLAVDGRSDVYSVGVVLYELVCGVAPFVAESPVSVAYKHVREEPIPPSQRNPAVPAALEQIIMSALAKDPEHRYQSADDLRADLLRFRRGRPLAAAPLTAIVAEMPTATVANAGMAAYGSSATVASPRVPVDPNASQGREPQRRRHPATFTLLTLLALIAIVGGILLLSMKLGSGQVTVTVPGVVGKTQAAATQDLAENNLFAVPKPVASDRPVGIVIAQNPKPGADVKKNSQVTISVSGGVGDAAIPDLAGTSVSDAKKQLTDAKFQVTVEPAENSTTVAPGSVIRTDPPYPGSAQVGSVVRIIPSKGITVPNIVNLPQAQGEAQLRQAGFDPQIQTEASNSVPSGSVTRTDPAVGTANHPGGSQITMFVSTGTAQITVPDVRGVKVGEAQTTLSDNNLRSSVVFEATSQKGNDGRVISQDPISGVLVDPQSTIVLTVGTYTPPPPTTVTTSPVPTTLGP